MEPRSREEDSELTEERMFREAIPVSPPEVTEDELEEMARADQSAEEHAPESKSESLDLLLGAPTEADITTSPYQYGGRLFFKKPPDTTTWWSGTAEFVGEYNILLTAAHCVRDDASGTWFTDFVFYRGYKNGGFARRFDINYVGTKQGWVDKTPARYQYDYAFLRTVDNSDVGHMGYKTLQSEAGWTEFGYPSNYGNNQIMQRVDGTRGRVQGGTVEMLGNPMRHGNSGGAWFIVAGPNNRQAMGNQSHNINGNTTDAWGPVFTNSTFDLLRFVRDAT
jgi:hypothetical protein